MKRFTVSILIAAFVLIGGALWAQDTLVYGTTDKVTQMDPASAYDFHTWELFDNIDESLLTYKQGTSEIIPGLAESYTVNKAGDEYVFKLRKGLKFTDGTPFTADAVKWTIDRVVALKGDPSWLVTQFVKSVTVVDPLTVKFTLNGPDLLLSLGHRRQSALFPAEPGRLPRRQDHQRPDRAQGRPARRARRL